MLITLSGLPVKPWWGKGTPVHQNNGYMHRGAIPNQTLVIKEHRALVRILQSITAVKVLPFAKQLDIDGLYCHDFVYSRDSFISNLKGGVMIGNFSERQRQPEAEARKGQLLQMNYKIKTLPAGAFAEGGEFLYAQPENILFAGQARNNAWGNRLAAKFLQAETLFEVISAGYHLDTVMALVKNKANRVVAALVCLDRISNQRPLVTFLKQKNISLIKVESKDSIGNGSLGTLAINCLSLSGFLVGSHKFQTPGVDAQLKSLGVKHLVTSVSQFIDFSGGSIHCLTNEL